MLRHNNYVGAAHHAPFQQKTGGITLAIADFRLYDRSLSDSEVSALFVDPASECCISAGLKDAFGVHNLDLSSLAMGGQAPAAVAITPSSAQDNGIINDESDAAQGCVSSDGDTTLELDISPQ